MASRAHSSCCQGKLRPPENYVTPADLVTRHEADKWTVFSRDLFNPFRADNILHHLGDPTPKDESSKSVMPKTPSVPSTHLLDYLQLTSLRLTGSIPSKECVKETLVGYKNSHWVSLQLACLANVGKALPKEVMIIIFNYVSGEMKRVKMAYKDKLHERIHHALQPCSVCHKLLAIDVDKDTEEIRSSGTKDRLTEHCHTEGPVSVRLHLSCCPQWLSDHIERFLRYSFCSLFSASLPPPPPTIPKAEQIQ